MVLPLLLSYSSTALRYGELGRTVLQSLHELHSMERALSIFHGALLHPDLENDSQYPSSPLQSFSAFDAHVGDCACQIRAQMFWDLVAFFRANENQAILSHAISRLKKIKVNAALLLQEIVLNYGKPRHPNLSVLVNYTAIWERIDFQSFLDLVPLATQGTIPSSNDPTESPATGTPTPRSSSHRRRDLTVEAAWNPRDIVSTTRFLTMCYLLSEFKIATIEAGPPTRVKVRVDLHPLYERNAKELEALQLTTAKTLSYHIKAHERMTRQVEAMQIYVSRVTTDWVKVTAVKERDFWSSLPEEFVATSDRRIACVSSYFSLLLVRDAWIKYDIPIFAMIQHFCSHGGYQNIFFRIVKNPMANISRNQYSAVGENDWFNTEMLSLDQVLASSWGTTPHMTMIGMSCDGTIEDFKQHLLESQHGLLPVGHHCDEADHCADKVSRTNISRLLAHFFAQHEQFPFRLRGVDDQFEQVAGALAKHLGKEAEEAFTEARSGADEFGTGRSTSLTTLEHIFLEYPYVLAKDAQSYGERPRVLGCKLE